MKIPREKHFSWIYYETFLGENKLRHKIFHISCSGNMHRFKYHICTNPIHKIGIFKVVDRNIKHQANLAIEYLNEVKSKKATINTEITSLATSQYSSHTRNNYSFK